MNTGTGIVVGTNEKLSSFSASENARFQVPEELSGVEADRLALEQFAEKQGDTPEQAKKDVAASKPEVLPMPTVEQVRRMEKDQISVEVEKILEDGLAEQWKAMPDALKPLFKQKGEQVSQAIADMIRQAI